MPNTQGFAEIQRPKPIVRKVHGAACVPQRSSRFIDSFGRHRERAEVHADALRRSEIEMRLDRLGRIHMNGTHEPPRLVRADREERQVNWPEPPTNVMKKLAIGGVARKEDADARGSHEKTAPECAITIEGRARRKMLCGRERDRHA